MRIGTVTVSGTLNQTSQNYAAIANGTTAQRPAMPWNGMLRYNTTLSAYEGYIDGTWWAIPTGQMTTRQITSSSGATSEPMIFVIDPTRANKMLSSEITTHDLVCSSVNTDDWCLVDPSLPSTNGFILPFAGTVVRLSAQVATPYNNNKRISIYINDTEYTNQIFLQGQGASGTISASNEAVNIDFNAGSLLRLRARYGGTSNLLFNALSGVVFTVQVKWRYTGGA